MTTQRVSSAAMNTAITRAIQQTQLRVQKLSQQIASGKALETVADDPIGAQRGMLHRARIRAGEQYLRNVDHAVSHLDAADGTLSQIQDILTEVRSLQTRASNDSMGAEERLAIARQVSHSIDAIVDLGNQQFSGVHIFGGTQSLTPPLVTTGPDGHLESVEPNPLGSDRPVVRRLGEDLSLSIRVPASDLFGEGFEAFDALFALRDALESNDVGAIQATQGDLEAAENRVVDAQTVVGALLQRAETARTQLENDNLINEAERSQAEDVDMAQALLDLNQQQAALEAAVSAGAQILRTSFLDYFG